MVGKRTRGPGELEEVMRVFAHAQRASAPRKSSIWPVAIRRRIQR